MKLRSSLLALAFAATFASPAAAAEFWGGVSAGVGIPIGSLSDVASTGFNLGLHAVYRVGDQLGLGGEVGWQGYGGNDDFEKAESVASGETVDASLRVVPVLGFAEFRLPGQASMVPFLRGGLGLYHLAAKREGQTFTSEDSETKFGLHVGGGLTGEITETIRWSVDGLYHHVLEAVADDDGRTTGSIITFRGRISFALVK